MTIETKPAFRAPPPLGSFVGKALQPVAAKRGFAAADLFAAWPEIVGPRYADCTSPESIQYPRKGGGEGVLTVRVDGGKAIYLQHELGALLQRVNDFLGAKTVGSIRLSQRPVSRAAPPAPPRERKASAEETAALERSLEGIADDGLREALRRLGGAVLASRSPKSEG